MISGIDHKMARDWDERADTLRGAMSAILDGYHGSRDDFYASGLTHVTDMLEGLKLADVNLSHAADQIAVEVGCGIGRLSEHLSHIFRHLYATDVSLHMIMRARHLPNVTYYCTPSLTILKKTVAWEQTDFVLSHIVFQHMPKDVFWRYLAESHTLLKPGGIFHTQLHETPTPVEYDAGETLLVRGYTKEELAAKIDPTRWQTLNLLAEAGISETWKWLTLRKM